MLPPETPSWAKAPEFSDQPAVLARLRESTAADRREQLEGRLQPVECQSCGTSVLVKKNSRKHTSVQWTTDSARVCPEFVARAASGETTALIDTCPRLQESIDDAVRNGLIEVP